MDWGAVVWIVLGVLGAALIAGGVIGYRGSGRTGVRALSGGAVAAGLAMWAVVAVTVPVSQSGSGGALEMVVTEAVANFEITEASFKTLLAEEDVKAVLGAGDDFSSNYYNYKEMASDSDPSQVERMNGFYALSVEVLGERKGITFSAVEFESAVDAKEHFEKVVSGTPELEAVTPLIGDASAGAELNGHGIGAMLVVNLGDTVLSLHTTAPDGEEAMASLDGLQTLAALVVGRL